MIRTAGTALPSIALILGGWLVSATGPARAGEAGQDPPPRAVDQGPKPVSELTLDPLRTFPIARGSQGPNERFVDTTLLPRDKAPRLDYVDQTADFTLGENLKGTTSGATATIGGDLDNGGAGTLTLTRNRGAFQDGEIITDTKGGSATVKGDLKPGIWVLDFSFKPLRVKTIEVPGKGRRQVYYLYYRVINRTGKPRAFVPQFTMVIPESGQRYQDVVLPNAVQIVRLIELREDPKYTLLGAVNIMGMIAPSVKDGVDDAVFGVAMWEVDGALAKADRMSIYVRGLSDGYKRIATPEGTASQVRYKTLRIDFDRPGDEIQLDSRELRLLDPPSEWIYW